MSLNAKSNIAFEASSKKGAERMKPPHSYIALIATAILNSPEKKLTLTEINDYLVKNYAFFRGSYQGWKNSVRHNLSFNKCFVKILRDPARPWGKDNLWAVSDLHDYLLADGSFRRRRRRKPKKDKAIEEAGDENFRETAKKQRRQQVGIENQDALTPWFPMLQTPTHKRSSETCRATPRTKPSSRKFSGPFSIESILAPDKPAKKECLSEDRTASSYTVPALTTREDLPHSSPHVYITEADSHSEDPYKARHDCYGLFNHHSCQCNSQAMSYGDVLDIYSSSCLCFHQVAPCSCDQHVQYCF